MNEFHNAATDVFDTTYGEPIHYSKVEVRLKELESADLPSVCLDHVKPHCGAIIVLFAVCAR